MAGVFGLKTTYKKQIKDIWTSYDPQYGYIFSSSTEIDQYDFNNSTTKLSDISLSLQQSSISGMVGKEHAYAVGGYSSLVSPNYISSVDRIDFTTHARASVSGLDTTNWWTSNRVNAQNATMSTIKYGYGMACHGYSSNHLGSGIDRDNALVYSTSNETVSSPIYFPSPTPEGMFLTQTAAVEAPNQSKFEFGYISGGYGRIPPSNPHAYRNIIRKLDFSSKVVSTLPGVLSNIKAEHSGASSKEHAYFFAGMGPSGSWNSVNKIEFSSDTVSPSTSFPVNLRNGGAFPDGNNFAYVVGGKPTYNAPNNTTNIYRFDYSNSTYTLGTEKISAEAAAVTAFAESPRKPITRFSTIYTAKNGNPISQSYGYFAGGFAPPQVCTIDRIDFSSETVVGPPVHGANLTQARNNLAAVSNSNYGYFAGGFAPPLVNLIDRLDFSNETVAVPTVGNGLSQQRTNLCALSNSNYGYFAGGNNGVTRYCVIDRLDFSNETVGTPPGGLTKPRSALTALSNSNYGYFAGGNDAVSYFNTIDRIDFSTEIVAVPPVGNGLDKITEGLTAVSSSNYGYFVGGSSPTIPGDTCAIDRLDFSSETVVGPPVHGANLTLKRRYLAESSNSNYAYFAGGYNGTTWYCTIDRIDFSSETVAVPSVGNELTQARYGSAGVSN